MADCEGDGGDEVERGELVTVSVVTLSVCTWRWRLCY